MTNKYIRDGQVARNRIALDIKYRELKRDEIERLAVDPEISSAFIGDSFDAKKKKKYWNKSYLDELSYAAIAESFNRDYLLYLDEVAEYVSYSSAARKRIIVAGIIAVPVIIAGIVVYKHVRSDKPIDAPAVESVSPVQSQTPDETALPDESGNSDIIQDSDGSEPPEDNKPEEEGMYDESTTNTEITQEV